MLNKLERSAIALKLDADLQDCYEDAIDAGVKLTLHEDCSGSYFYVVGGCNDFDLMNKLYRDLAYFDGAFAVYACMVCCRKSDFVSDFCRRHGYSYGV